MYPSEHWRHHDGSDLGSRITDLAPNHLEGTHRIVYCAICFILRNPDIFSKTTVFKDFQKILFPSSDSFQKNIGKRYGGDGTQ